jgi:mannose-6-phosphate isomerase
LRLTEIYKLQNQIKHYEWGSPILIPQFLGLKNNNGIPYAEMWMGTYTSAPSKAISGNITLNLKDIAGELPFLFKLLGVDKPLSIQAHPNKKQAMEGFMREEESGLALNAPLRNYKDVNHKPEIFCALSPFKLMVGFRQPEEIYKSLKSFLSVLPQLKELISPLLRALDTGLLAAFFRNLFCFSNIGCEYLSTLISEVKIDNAGEAMFSEQWKLMKFFASQYPGDSAILSPLYLNVISLHQWQAIYIPDGVLHAYISGFGAELMANSDNVLRGGLSPKHVDIPELMNVVNFEPFNAQISSPDSSSVFYYPSMCEDFSLCIIRSENDSDIVCEKSPAIYLVVEGELSAGGMIIRKGESFFIPENIKSLSLRGNFSLLAASYGTW